MTQNSSGPQASRTGTTGTLSLIVEALSRSIIATSTVISSTNLSLESMASSKIGLLLDKISTKLESNLIKSQLLLERNRFVRC